MILLTGAAGFIGYRIAKELQKQGIPFVSVDRLEAFQSRPEHRDVRHTRVYPPEAMLNGLPVGITAIVHMGASSSTTEMRVDYLKQVNVDYSKALWNFARGLNIPFVYASSAATYGAGEEGYDDDESKMKFLKPLNPYGMSKLEFDLWALDEDRAGRAPPAWSGFKFFNVYGYGERHKQKQASVVIQGFDQIRDKGELRLFKSHKSGIADGEQKRDFIYVQDVVAATLFALQKPIRRGIFNLGTGLARSFQDLAKATFQAMGMPANITFIDTPVEIRDRYQYFTQATMDRLKAEGYTRSFTSLEDGVAQTVSDLKTLGR
ncbi:MAG: ADP-glyceromanno-heptose 6-epimerase [Bdellovibrionales bacterium]|nr:ADP-glyceromanno-heptose 6-epimerase [Bdellovibrionales bacterium]